MVARSVQSYLLNSSNRLLYLELCYVRNTTFEDGKKWVRFLFIE